MNISEIQKLIAYCNTENYNDDIINELKKFIPCIEHVIFGRAPSKPYAIIWVKLPNDKLCKIAKYDYDYNSHRYNLWVISGNTEDNDLNSLIYKINENSNLIQDILKIGIFIWELKAIKKQK